MRVHLNNHNVSMISTRRKNVSINCENVDM